MLFSINRATEDPRLRLLGRGSASAYAPSVNHEALTILRFFSASLLNPGIDERLASKVVVDGPQKRAVAQGVSPPISKPVFVDEVGLHPSYRVSRAIDRRIELVAHTDIDGACPAQFEANQGDRAHSGQYGL